MARRINMSGSDAGIGLKKAVDMVEKGIRKSLSNSKISDEIKQKWESGEGVKGKFESLSDVTLKYKEGRGILLETEEMINSLFSDSDSNSLKIGIRDEKYKYHHTGTVKMPERKVIPTEKDELHDIVEKFGDDLADQIVSAL